MCEDDESYWNKSGWAKNLFDDEDENTEAKQFAEFGRQNLDLDEKDTDSLGAFTGTG